MLLIVDCLVGSSPSIEGSRCPRTSPEGDLSYGLDVLVNIFIPVIGVVLRGRAAPTVL